MAQNVFQVHTPNDVFSFSFTDGAPYLGRFINRITQLLYEGQYPVSYYWSQVRMGFASGVKKQGLVVQTADRQMALVMIVDIIGMSMHCRILVDKGKNRMGYELHKTGHELANSGGVASALGGLGVWIAGNTQQAKADERITVMQLVFGAIERAYTEYSGQRIERTITI